MAGTQGNDRAILTARAGIARAQACRAGFAPVDADTNGRYIWTNELGMTSQEIVTVWTEEVR